MATGGKTQDKPKDKTPEKPVVKPVDPLESLKPKSDPSSWLGIKDDDTKEKEKADVKSDQQKPAVAAKPKSSASDWLGLKDDDIDDDENDYLKASTFSTPARQGQAQVSGNLHEFEHFFLQNIILSRAGISLEYRPSFHYTSKLMIQF